ncbi:hypothetical protein EV673_1415 [Limnobacter thiooxidans]|uniref:Uncharacterized protein n=1 Tax=Limnobacter thiooxidans TaxID=131080 RepID=A0AA86IZC4_9BURK|nr:hypothetical protein EV673_1415 [Limnobacter thiooxidans]BET24713.1 hypothetical protein RGQ30_02140 [Limnobacter thiooxidans]
MRRIFSVIEANNSVPATPPAQAHVQAPEECINAIQAAWAEALRCDFGRAREALLCRLADTCSELARLYPNDAKVLLWNGIVMTGYAKSLGGLCGLQLQLQAKIALEQAMALAPQDGAPCLYLGLLYDQAPEAPYGFGDEARAKALLEKGLNLMLNSGQVDRRTA